MLIDRSSRRRTRVLNSSGLHVNSLGVLDTILQTVPSEKTTEILSPFSIPSGKPAPLMVTSSPPSSYSTSGVAELTTRLYWCRTRAGSRDTSPSTVRTSGAQVPATRGFDISQVIWLAELALITQSWFETRTDVISASSGNWLPAI